MGDYLVYDNDNDNDNNGTSINDYTGGDYTGGDYTKDNIEIMLTILLFLSFVSPFIHTFNSCIKNCKNRYDRLKLTVYKIESDDNLLLDECPICLEKYVVNDKIIHLNCRHSFHKQCIYIWLKDNNTCPQCRENII